jgi:gluconate 2-dehydrogenase gamma chain
MDNAGLNRRRFLTGTTAGVSSAWIALHWPEIVQAHEHAVAAASTSSTAFEFFTAADAAEIEAVAAQIIPTDTSAGAREAAAVYFIDCALAGFHREHKSLYKEGLAMLQERTQQTFSGASTFSKLNSDQQIQVLKAIEQTDFFEMVRVHTIMGFLADPDYGGNRGEVGWKLIGFEQKAAWKPPFGYYDAEENG